MSNKEYLDNKIIIKDDSGYEKEFHVEAMFKMDGESYAIVTGDTETLLMRIEDEGDEQYLVGINDPEERDAILSAYEIAMNTNKMESD
ncbi:hypothetical protein J2S74_000966 [Evansella vedderi]|uniref:DUF1292 domain-containing protein n=1 Tax=Evansella vedderi TaxID=38282 RepID=A0ABT9ZQW5_9BACI|nr:DUF1292 domain-containing protein [Evansella vedderi]MDQ0253594.1 hypothetical protein [Evansella vedderi]